MILVRKSMQERLLLKVEASSDRGDGSFYLTDKAMAYEVMSRGIYLDFIPHGLIRRIAPAGGMAGSRKLRMEWDEDGAMHSFEFRTGQHAGLLEAAKRAGIS